MQYLEKAPKSPQKGAPNNTSTRPSHYYNYAKHNNPMQYSNTTAARNPYATHSKALPEDKTIEDIDNTGTGNTQSLLTILLIGLTVVIILTGGCLGGYFLFRHSKSKPQTAKSKAKEALLDSSEEIASHKSPAQPESYESEEIASHIPKAQAVQQNTIEVQKTSDITDTILVYQIYFNNVHDQEEFIGYTPQNQLPYNSLSLEDIAKIFQSNGWTKEKGMMNNELRNGLCEYFEYNLQDIGQHDYLSSAERLCSNENSLIVYPQLPLMFYVLSNQYHSPHQLGVELSFKLLIFKINNQLYSLNHDQLQPMVITPFVGYRRRLIASNLPLESIILEKKQIWTRLPDGYQGKSYQEWEYAISYAHTMQPNIHIAHGIPFEPNIHMHQQYIIHTHQPNMHHVQLSTHQQYITHTLPQQREIDEQQQFCNAERLNQLRFVDLEFTLVINPKDGAAETWHCHYFPHTYNAPQYQQTPRRRMTEEVARASAGAPMHGDRASESSSGSRTAEGESASEERRRESFATVESGQLASGQMASSESALSRTEPLAQAGVAGASERSRAELAGAAVAEGVPGRLRAYFAAGAAAAAGPPERLDRPGTTERLDRPGTTERSRADDTPGRLDSPGTTERLDRPGTTERSRADDTPERLDRPGTTERLDSPDAIYAAAAPPYDTMKDISLDPYWFGNILNNDQTKCYKIDCLDGEECETTNPCRNIIGEGPELDRSRTTDDCDCYDACGRQWQVLEEGKSLTMLQCPLNTHATDFEGILQYPSTYSEEEQAKLLFGGRYEQNKLRQFIITHDIPYWPCQLLKDAPVVRAGSDSPPDAPIATTRSGDTDIPIARMRREDSFSPGRYDSHIPRIRRNGPPDAYRQLRRLAIDADTSRAWSKDNMFMIIASTIFFILIGIQSFYWLSHSF